MKENYQKRRQRVMEQMQGGIAILFSAPTRKKNSDVLYEYRQDSSLYYLTGFNEPESILAVSYTHLTLPTKRIV